MDPRHTPHTNPAKSATIELKRDLFGTIRHNLAQETIIRDTAAAPLWARGIARALARREANTLRALDARLRCPRLIDSSRDHLVRSYLPGKPLYAAEFEPRLFFLDALHQLRRMHAQGVVHNDLAKEANWICTPDGRAGIVDFQAAMRRSRSTRLFRTLAREDLRHLLKHKRHYAPELLTARQRAILAQPLWPARFWRSCVKPPYRFVTRRILGWQERDSAIERSI